MFAWLQADSPWSALATCIDIKAALDSGDVKRYESRLPVHQDGSCNGLQHYAAIGRDVDGGKAVRRATRYHWLALQFQLFLVLRDDRLHVR